MAASTGPVLALGGITIFNESVIHSQPFNWRLPIATGLLAGVCALLDTAVAGLGTGLAWVALATVLLTRVNPAVPSPTESFATWWTPAAQK
jgi:hypothetical protein